MIKKLHTKDKKYLIAAFVIIWLYIIPIITNYLFLNLDNPHKVIKIIEKDVANKVAKFETISTDGKLISSLINKEFTEKELKTLSDLPFAYQIYEAYNDGSKQLLFWNNNSSIPLATELALADGKHVLKKPNTINYFIKKTYTVKDKKFLITCIIPMYWDYFIETDYLKKEFAANAKIANQYIVSDTPTIYAIRSNENESLFYIKAKENKNLSGTNKITIVCRTFAVLLIFLLLIFKTNDYYKNKQQRLALAFFVVTSSLLWVITCYTNFFFNRDALQFFNSGFYNAKPIFLSLAHLSFAIAILLVFIFFQKINTSVHLLSLKTQLVYGNFFQLGKVLLFQILSFVIYWLIRSIIANASISFNITNFFSLTIYTVLGFILAALLIIAYHSINVHLLQIHKIEFSNSFTGILLNIAVSLVLLFVIYFIHPSLHYINVTIWIMLCYVLLKYLPSKTGVGLTISANWTIIYGILLAFIFLTENNKKELQERKFFAKKIAFQSDPNTENLLSIALSRFTNDYVRRNFWQQNASSNFRKTIIAENFIGYLNRFQTNIYVFDSLERPIQNEGIESISYFNTLIQNQATKVTNVSDLYFVEIGFDQFSYIFRKLIKDENDQIVGSFIIEANPLTYKSKTAALSPELFKQRYNRIEDNGNNYTYAVYENLLLKQKYIDYDIPVRITNQQMPTSDDSIQYRNGYEELWLKTGKNSVVVVGQKKQYILSAVTLFAYLFLTLLLLNSIQLFYSRIKAGQLNKKHITEILQLNLSKQVQFIVWLVSLLTFVAVTYIIIIQFQNRFQKNNKERLIRSTQILLADIQNKLLAQNVFDDEVKIYESISNQPLTEMVIKMSEIHNLDFNIYDLQGNLKISTQPFLESKSIISNKINSIAYYNLLNQKSAQFLQTESIGTFHYLSMYVPIRDDKGKPYGYLNIPYYSSSSDLNQEISNFLIIIINITAFVFLIAGLIAWLITNRITNSFELIGSKMKDIELGKNEPIIWNRNDEIGGLVNEYNKMVAKLADSAQQLAKNEREGAWREMARQIAHEIKNPLTPMKLSIQYLQKSIASGNGNIEALTEKVSTTLVDQIDHLSKIASDFSNFANITNAVNEDLNIVSIVQQVVNLLQHEEQAVLKLIANEKNICITADATHMNRLITNIIKNGLQAYDETAQKEVTIIITKQEAKCRIEIEDKAGGIPYELQSKIFTPNFTTKSSGTGLGLAICKGIVEKAQGTINFLTKEGAGTQFTIELPLA